MAIVLLWIYGAWDVQFLKWPRQNHHGANMKGCDIKIQDAFIWNLSVCLFSCKVFTNPKSFDLDLQVAAIFKIGNSKDIPEIPEHLSDDAKSFIKLCLQRDPSARPTASQLLDHHFVRDQAVARAGNINLAKDSSSCSLDGSRTPVCSNVCSEILDYLRFLQSRG